MTMPTAHRVLRSAVVVPRTSSSPSPPRRCRSTPSSPSRCRPSGDTSLRDEVVERWDALALRARDAAYATPSSSSSSSSSSSHTQATQDSHQFVDDRARTNAAGWCYSVVDAYELDRSSVALAMWYFDRATSSGIAGSRELALALVASLFLAVKVQSSGNKIFDPSRLASLLPGGSKATVSGDDVVAMEGRICRGLGWRLNPPTASMFVDLLSPLVERDAMTTSDRDGGDREFDRGFCRFDVGPEARRHLLSQSRFLCERAVLDASLATRDPSSVAAAAISVAMDAMRFPFRSIEWFRSLPLERDWADAEACARRLHEICAAEGHRPELAFEASPEAAAPEVAAAGGRDVRTVTPTRELDDGSRDVEGVKRVVSDEFENMPGKRRRVESAEEAQNEGW